MNPAPPTPYEVPYHLYAACTEAEAVAEFIKRHQTPPAAVIVERIGVWAGPVPGWKKESEA